MMLFLKYAILCALGVAALSVLITAFRHKRGLRTLGWSAVSGVGSLCAVALIGRFTVFTLAINAYTLLCSAVMGIPGVLLMMATKFVWGL